MSGFVLLHCTRGRVSRSKWMAKAVGAGCETCLPSDYDENPRAFRVSAASSEVLEKFLQEQVAADPTVAAFRSDAPSGGSGRLQPRCRVNRAAVALPQTAAADGATAASHTASYMADYYKFPVQATGAGKAPVIGIISLGGGFLASDLSYYWRTVLGLSTVPTVLTVSIDGAKATFAGAGADEENTLDLEIAGGTCPAATLVLYSAPNTDLGFYHAIAAATSVAGSVIGGRVYRPTVVSISWGAPESSWSASSLAAYNQLLASAVASGVTVLAASGDSGSGDGVPDGDIHADFPASSPNVVACGGTTLPVSAGEAERAWSWDPNRKWGGGGGISRVFRASASQLAVVKYPTAGLAAPLKGKRALPDVALNADPFTGWTIAFNGKLYVNAFGGTSCVAPAMAGLLGRLNLRYPLSFSASLYAAYRAAAPGTAKSGFGDVTLGSNDSVAAPGVFSAGPGYDFCTGLGTVDGTKLRPLLAATAVSRVGATDPQVPVAAQTASIPEEAERAPREISSSSWLETWCNSVCT